jgi:hypothetical protein
MKRQFTILVTLAGFVGLQQAILVGRAVVPAQDAVRFVAMAQMIEAEGVLASLPQLPEQPLFPILVWLTHAALASLFADVTWAVAVQVAAAWPLFVCVVPVYGTLRRWIGEPAAISGTLLFFSLSEVSRIGADGLGDSTHLCCFCLAIWAISASVCGDAARGLAAVVPMFGAGLALGLAILARAESWVMLPALAIAGCKVRLPARRLFFGGALLSVGLVLACAPYWAILGTREGMDQLRAGRGSEIGEVLNSGGETASLDSALRWTAADGEPNTFSKKESTVTSRFRGYRGLATFRRGTCCC